MLEFAVALQADDDGAHPVALCEYDFVERALVEGIEQARQVSHRFTDSRQLVVGDADALSCFVDKLEATGAAGRMVDGLSLFYLQNRRHYVR